MTVRTNWPDRATYAAAIEDPGHCFDDPELRSAAFARNRMGRPMAWSGGRAIVFRAESASGRTTAVRFLVSPDEEASVRYESLTRHLHSHPVETMVPTRWIEDGLHIGSSRYPLITMDWVDGMPLDRYLDAHMTSSLAPDSLPLLADQWRRCCVELAEASVGHGDVHAGNTLVHVRRDGRPQIRLVDYDNVWIPGLYTPCREAGHPAFQHPAHRPTQHGPYIDAFPNTLTYVSLMALASDSSLWRYHDGLDDALLFQPRDLQSTDGGVWVELLRSPDAVVRSMTRLTIDWLRSRAERYETLEQVIAATGVTDCPRVAAHNVWAARTTESDVRRPEVWRPMSPHASGDPVTRPDSHASPPHPQTWGGQTAARRGVPSTPTRPPGPASGRTAPASRLVLWAVVGALLLAVLVLWIA